MVATKLEGQAVVSYAWGRLTADTGAGGVNTLLGGRIYRDRVPQAAALPAALVRLVSSTPTNTLGGYRVAERTLIDVEIVGDGTDYAPINPAAKRADVVLQNAIGSDSGVTVVELVKEQTVAFVEDDAGKAYAHIVQSYATPSYAA